MIGSADHLASEVATLLEMAHRGVLDLDGVITASVPLEAPAVNDAMDRLERFGDEIRTVITP